MARQTVNFKITDDGRDKNKVFVLTELPCSRAESCAMRILLELIASGFELPEGYEKMGMAGIYKLGIKSLAYLPWTVLEPVMDEFWTCIQIMPDPSKAHVVRNLIEEDIEDVATRIKLRMEVLKLHTGFSMTDAN